MKRVVLMLVLATVSTNALALDEPQGSKYDSRIQFVDYNPKDVVEVHAYVGLGAQIVFSPGEKTLDIASGFSQGWEFSNRRNILYLKPKSVQTGDDGTNGPASIIRPKAGEWDTNLLVTTNEHMYAFDLRLLPSKKHGKMRVNNDVSYRVQFRYPHEAMLARQKQAARAKAQARLSAKAPPVNWSYAMQVGDKSSSIAPTMAYDDGRFTYLKFPNNKDFPAVFLVGATGKESLVNSHVISSRPGGPKDILVVHRVAPQMVLRFGDEVVGIYNEDFSADGVPPENGTTVPGVQRVLLKGGDNE